MVLQKRMACFDDEMNLTIVLDSNSINSDVHHFNELTMGITIKKMIDE